MACARFILHYFINVTHAAVEDVRIASATSTDDEVIAVPSRPLEAGEIARPVYRMTLTLRDAWERLRRASDPPPSRRGGFEEPCEFSFPLELMRAEPLSGFSGYDGQMGSRD